MPRYQQAATPPQLNAFRRFALTSSAVTLAVLGGVIVGLVVSLTFLVFHLMNNESGNPGSSVLTVIIAFVVSSLIFTAVYIPLIRWQRRDFDRRLGVITTANDRIALEAWFKNGSKPGAKRLQPALQAYIAYMERITSGAVLPFGGKYNYVMVSLAAMSVILRVISYISGESSLSETLTGILIFGVLGFMWWPSRKSGGDLYFRLFNRRARQRIARMKRQLN